MAESLVGVQRANPPQVDKSALRTALGGVFISGLGPLLVRDSPVDAAATAFWRLIIALPAALWLARREEPLPPKAKAMAILAGLLLAGDLVLWNRAILSTTILEATLLVMIYPLLVAVGGFLIWRERITGRLGLGGALAFAGLIIMSLGPVSGQSSVSGNLLAVAAASTGESRTRSGPRPDMNTPPNALRNALLSIRDAGIGAASARISAT